MFNVLNNQKKYNSKLLWYSLIHSRQNSDHHIKQILARIWWKRNAYSLLAGTWIDATLWQSGWSFLKKEKSRVTIWYSSIIHAYIPRRLYILLQKYVHGHASYSSSFKASKRNQLTCSASGEWILKIGFAYTMELGQSKNNIMEFAGKWMQLLC